MTDIPYRTALIVGAGPGISASAARGLTAAGLKVGLAARTGFFKQAAEMHLHCRLGDPEGRRDLADAAGFDESEKNPQLGRRQPVTPGDDFRHRRTVQRRLANGGVVVPGDIDDRHQNSGGLETTPQLDPGFILQVDVHDDTHRFLEIVVILKSLGRRKQDTVVTVSPQQPLYPPEHARVVIDDKNDILISHHRHP